MRHIQQPRSDEKPAERGKRLTPPAERLLSAGEVRRAADALLREGTKPSVLAVRQRLGGGSPNTLTPLLSQYWAELGQRLEAGPQSLEHVPEALARVTELFWRRAVEEARERLKTAELRDPGASAALRDQVGKLSTALAEARAREGEHLTHLAELTRERGVLREERADLLALLRATQELLEQQMVRVGVLERRRPRTGAGMARGSRGSPPLAAQSKRKRRAGGTSLRQRRRVSRSAG